MRKAWAALLRPEKFLKKCKVCLTFYAKQTILKMQSELYNFCGRFFGAQGAARLKRPHGRARPGRAACAKEDLPMKTRIPQLRKERRLSQSELADAVGVTRQTITSLEVGKYTASLVLAYKIARYFGLTIEEVFDFSDLEG